MESYQNPKEYPENEPAAEEFPFLQEKIKRKPVTREMLVHQLGKVAVSGIIFGMMASVGFCAFQPWAEKKFQKNQKEVSIPRDEQQKGEQTAQPEEPVKEKESVPEVTVDSYLRMNSELYAVARETDKSIVEIKGIHGKEGWTEESYDTVNSVSGAVIADTGAELLLLADSSIMKEAESLTATFVDETAYEAKLKKQDKNLGIAVFSVRKSDMHEGTLQQVKPVVLGNSTMIRRGDMLFALGKPFGYSGGFGHGMASSVRKKITIPDGDYSLLLSDIPGSANGSGFLTNIHGEIVGMIKPELAEGDGLCATNAMAISDLKEAVELLSNGKSVPYLGVQGTEVTEQVEKEQGIPRGIYVKNIELDSPAMEAGIQRGDIITSLGKMKIRTWTAYQNTLLDYKPGEQIKVNGVRRGNDGYVEVEYKIMVGSRE